MSSFTWNVRLFLIKFYNIEWFCKRKNINFLMFTIKILNVLFMRFISRNYILMVLLNIPLTNKISMILQLQFLYHALFYNIYKNNLSYRYSFTPTRYVWKKLVKKCLRSDFSGNKSRISLSTFANDEVFSVI